MMSWECFTAAIASSCYFQSESVLNEPDEFPVSMVNSLFRAKQIRCSAQNRESSARPWNSCANGRRNRAESVEMAEISKNSLLFSLFSGNFPCSRGKGAPAVIAAPRRPLGKRLGQRAKIFGVAGTSPATTGKEGQALHLTALRPLT